MNQTIEDSKKMVVLVGGDTIVLEDGKLEMPPEQAKNAKEVGNNIEIGNFQEIKVGNCKAEDILSKEQIAILMKNRKARKTQRVYARTIANQR